AAAHERSTVLPLGFGTVLADDDDVCAGLLVPLRDELRRLLDRFENLVEMRLAAQYDERVLLAEIVGTDGAGRQLRANAARSLELGERVAGAYERIQARDAGGLLERLQPLL